MGTKIVDLHCDSLTHAYDNGQSLLWPELHFSLDRLTEGWHWCQFMAVFIPDTLRGDAAAGYFDAVHAFYLRQLAAHGDRLRAVSALGRIGQELESSPFTSVLTVEGGAVLAGDPANVERIYEKGVRMMTLTWNGANELCGGVLSGGGFTAMGREAVRRMEALGMVVDVSHLSDEGFRELCGFAERPFVASHSNSRVVCPHPRNLTDDMFREIVARGGLVGLNYYDKFIVDGGGSTDIADLVRHTLRFLELGGEDALALGSDFDGAEIPDYIRGVDKMQTLIDALDRAGVSRAVVDKLLYGNAIRFFGRF